VGTPTLFDLELDLDAFNGPFDLLLALVLRDEVELVEVPVAAIVLAYAERLTASAEELDLTAVSEFLILVAALCELKARLLVASEDEDVEELDPEQAAVELAERLAEYRRFKQAAGWLADRREEIGRRVFRSTPPPLAPRRPPAEQLPEDPQRLAVALAALLEPPERFDAAQMPRRHVSIRPFLDRFRSLLVERGTFVFDEQVNALGRAEQAAAFLALLELYKRGEIRVGQAETFAPIRVARSAAALRRHHASDDARDDELAGEAVA
jgi:segregation and condensation protein A